MKEDGDDLTNYICSQNYMEIDLYSILLISENFKSYCGESNITLI